MRQNAQHEPKITKPTMILRGQVATIQGMHYKCITNGDLKILFYYSDIHSCRDLAILCANELERLIKLGQYTGKMQPGNYISETEKLIKIADKILNKKDIFKYIPLTKDGYIPLNRNILMVDTICRLPKELAGKTGNTRLQLRLTDCYLTDEEIISGKPSRVAKKIDISFFSAKGKQHPIIDEFGRFTKIDENKSSN